MRGAIARPEGQYEPRDQVVFGATSEFFNATLFNWNLPEARKQIYNSPYFHVTDLLYYIPNVWDGKTTPLCSLIKSAEVNDEAEFVAPGLGYGETRSGPRSMHRFCQPSLFNGRKFITDELTMGG